MRNVNILKVCSTLDPTEKDTIKLGKKFAKTFENLYLKAIEFNGYTRTGAMDFPALDKLNEDAYNEMTCFKDFLEKVELHVIEKKLLGTILPLTPDHMFREECYYQTKLALVTKLKKPDCDPTKPRVNA